MSKKPPSRAARLKKARAEAAAVLGLPDSDLHTKRYALLSVEYDNLTARYLSGDRLDVTELTRLENAMTEIRATLPPPVQQVELVIVAKAEVQKCERCGHEFATQKVPQTLEERQRLARPSVTPKVSDEGVEGRREKETEASDSQHSKEHSRAQRLPHLGSSSCRYHQRSNAENERE